MSASLNRFCFTLGYWQWAAKTGGFFFRNRNHGNLHAAGKLPALLEASQIGYLRGGTHAEAIVGYGVLSGQNGDGTTSNNDPTGYALGLGFGNDWWVSDEWSRPLLRSGARQASAVRPAKRTLASKRP